MYTQHERSQVQTANGVIQIDEGCWSKSWRHQYSWDLAPATPATAFMEYQYQFLKRIKLVTLRKKNKPPTPKLCLLQQRYSARETEICNSIWMITEGMSQPHIATACFVYVSHTNLSLSIIHFYLFYSIGVAKTESCYKNKVNASLSAEFSKTICAAEPYSAILMFKWAVGIQNNCQITIFMGKVC